MEAQRFPISVSLIGVMIKDKSKMYMASVFWSDRSDVVIYRTFQDFKKIHKQMKKQFPAANKLNKSDRIIPTFRDYDIKRGREKRGTTKSLARLKVLQKYCNELLSCDPRVCQCADLIGFFQPKDQDLQPEFSKNSIMITPSDDEIANIDHSGSGTVTQPFVTETYRCVAPYETKDTKNKPFKVAVDVNVDVLIKDKAGWWLVENEEKQIAWFPAPYLEKLDDDDWDEDDTDETLERGMLYTAVKNYKATKDDEINVTIGAAVKVLQKSDNGWWLIRYNGKAGYIPTMYLQPHNYPHVHLTAAHQHRRASATLQAPSSKLEHCQQLSRSQGNMLQLPPARSSSPHPLQPHKTRSHSLDVTSLQLSAQPTASTSDTNISNISTSPSNAKHAPLPTIMVEMDGKEEHGRRLSAVSDGSFGSSSSDVSFTDDLSSFSDSSSLNLSYSARSEQLHLSRTPPPMGSSLLSPTNPAKKIMSVSDPNLHKGTKTPKVPPRPQGHEILTRCTTITRKNASRGNLPPTQTEILGR